jgi:hypothetical protein
MATTAAVWTNSGGAEDGAMAALLAVPCPLVQWQLWQRCKQQSATATVVAVQATMSQHCWPFLAFMRYYNNSSGMDNGVQ